MGAVSKEVEEYLILKDIARQPVAVQERFEKLVRGGATYRFAAMCACQQAPGTANTDRAFSRERRAYMENMSPALRDRLVATARKAGINTSGKFYVGGLGRYTDPAAWVSTIDDAVEVCKRKNLTATGLVNRKGTPVEREPVALAPDLKSRIVKARLAADAQLRAGVSRSPRKLQELEKRIEDEHSYSRTKRA